MDCKSLGQTIANLRRRHGLTQATLAERLGVTDKAVSRWENGQGYPDVTTIPRIAKLFGVSIDSLMLGEKKGIVIAGNMLIDIVKSIADYPEKGMLTYITDISKSVGGCAPNTAIDLAKIDSSLPVSVVGKLGNDENGKYVLSQLERYGINTRQVSFTNRIPTSFTDVMSIPSGERTFFHQRGANIEFSPADVDIAALFCEILHIGYILMLDLFDEEDKEYGTVMARFLHTLQKSGIRTSIDMVSDSQADYSKKVLPALKYCNYVIINEIECCGIWKLDPRNADGSLNQAAVIEAMRRTVEAGVRDKVIVHSKEAGFLMDANQNITVVPSLKIPSSAIKGSVGAGDAFCAGCLYGLYNQYGSRQLLEFASAAAACNLFAANSVDGMRNKNEILKIAEKYERLTL